MRKLTWVLVVMAGVALAEKAAPTGAAPAALSDVAKVPRPADGEYLGLYLKGQKIGFMFTSLTVSADQTKVTAISEMHVRAKVGKNVSDRTMKDTRVYEARPGGKLLSLTVEQRGDGGDQTLIGTAGPTGLKVVVKRPGQPDEVKQLAPSKETVEDADQVRVAMLRNKKLEGTVTDALDLESYALSTTPGDSEVRTIGGVKTKLRKVTSLSQKEKVPAEAWVDENGRVLELRYGPMMTGYSEAPEVAKRIDLVEVFGLTRVVLPRQPSPAALSVPGSFTMTLTGVPEKFWVNTARQKWRSLGNGKVEVTVSAEPPKTLKVRPLIDPNGGTNLKSTLAVEASNPAIVKLAKEIAGGEKDAWTAAKKVTEWVNLNLGKDYGASSDTATGVLRLKKGDCTEHSLLTVSLLRALGIPAKRVDGLVYLMNDDKVPALYWHEWVEAYVGEWTQLDPTFGQPIAHAARLAVGEESSAEITPLIGSMAVVDVK